MTPRGNSAPKNAAARRDIFAACAHCGAGNTPTVCKRCGEHVCRPCARAKPPGCPHLIIRLTPVQLHTLKRLPRSESQVRADGLRRRTYLSLERLGVAAWDLATLRFCARTQLGIPLAPLKTP